MTEFEKFIYLYNVFKKGILHGTASKNILDIFDYYLRYLDFIPYIDETITPKKITITIHPTLRYSYKTFIEARNALSSNSQAKPYYSKLTQYNLFDEVAPLFSIENNKGYKNLSIPIYLIREQVLKSKFNIDEYNLSPVFKQIGDIIIIKDVWEKK